jgi:hypothetical protein
LTAAFVSALTGGVIVIENPTPDNIANVVWNDLLTGFGLGAALRAPKAARGLVELVMFTIGYFESAPNPSLKKARPLIATATIVQIPYDVWIKGWPAVLQWEKQQL